MKKNTRPFFILGLIHLAIISYTVYKKKQKAIPLLYISIGVAYIFEYFVLNVFKMYRYYPKVFRNGWIDSVFGALLSQALYIPISATFLSSFKLTWRWRVIFALSFGLVERIFIKLRVFKNNTWSTLYTIVMLPFYFWVIDIFWNYLHRRKTLRSLTTFFFYWVTYTNIYYFVVAFTRSILIRINIASDKYMEHFIWVPLYTMFQAILGTIITYSTRGKLTVKRKLLFALTLYGADQLLIKRNVLKVTRKFRSIMIPVHYLLLSIGEYFKEMIKRRMTS